MNDANRLKVIMEVAKFATPIDLNTFNFGVK
jgi:hypothetical protein